MNDFIPMAVQVQIDEVQKPVEQDKPYISPELFDVASAAEVIQGAHWRGPRDHPNSWPIYNL